jgi:plastocyanin
MNSKIAVAVGLAGLLATMLVSTSFAPAFAADVSVSIVPGASSKSTDSFAPNPVNAKVGDTVTWTNDDSQPHTVTSGSNGTPDNKFNSSPNFQPLLVPKGIFKHTFAEAGDYPYYCGLHPNMVGTVKVTAGGEPTPTEAKVTATLDGKSYDIAYKSTTSKATAATIDSGNKSVKVTFDKAGDVELTLPKAMISGINSIMAGGQELLKDQPTETADMSAVKFTLPAGSTAVEIKGATVVPEFSVIAVAVLGISIAAIIGYTRFAKNSGIGFFGRA